MLINIRATFTNVIESNFKPLYLDRYLGEFKNRDAEMFGLDDMCNLVCRLPTSELQSLSYNLWQKSPNKIETLRCLLNTFLTTIASC